LEKIKRKINQKTNLVRKQESFSSIRKSTLIHSAKVININVKEWNIKESNIKERKEKDNHKKKIL
jgi:hypothetical protein